MLRPALLLGVGGLGLAVLQQFRRAIAERWGKLDGLPHLRTLFLDTDPEAEQSAVDHPDRAMALGGRDWALARLNRPAHYLKNDAARFDRWLHPQLLHRMPKTPSTAGFRAFGRLALLDNYRSVVARLRQELEATLESSALTTAAQRTGLGLRTNRPRIYIAAGLGGGTGSGMLVDLAYILRHQLKSLGYAAPEVVGVLLVPPADRACPRHALANTYAALTELAHFSSPRITFEVRFDPKEEPIADADRPLTRAALVSLPKAPDPRETSLAAGLAAGLLYRELLTPLGRTADDRRAEYRAAFPTEGASVQAFGLYRLALPRGALARCAVRRFIVRLLERWASKEASHLRDPVKQWLDDQLARIGLLPESVVTRLHATAEATLGSSPEALFDAHADAIAAPAAAGRLGPEAASVALDQLIRMVGRPDRPDDDSTRTPTAVRLEEDARAAVTEADRHLSDLAVHFVEQPGFRLAAAEEVVRQLTERTVEATRGFEELSRRLEEESIELFARLMGLIAVLKGSGFGSKSPKAIEFVQALREYPRKRLRALEVRAVLVVFRSIAGSLPELLRELNFARQRLTELAQRTTARPKTWSSSSLGPGKLLLPIGCRTLEDAADALIGSLPVEEVRQFEEQVQAQIRRQFGGLIRVCVDTADTTEVLLNLVSDAADVFVTARVPDRDPAEAMFAVADEQHARREITQAFDDALPDVGNPRVRPEAHLCVLSAPDTPAGIRFRELAENALADSELVAVHHPEDIAFYRELRQLSLADLPQLGPLALDAAQQVLNAEQVSPFARTDVQWQPPSRD